jgi:hypothetical protein
MQDSGMHEPGLDLHEWETRWQQLLEVAHESPADAVGEMDRLLDEMLGERDFAETEGEARKQFEAARDTMRRYERGEAGAADLADAINGYSEVYELLTTEELDPQQAGPGAGRSA